MDIDKVQKVRVKPRRIYLRCVRGNIVHGQEIDRDENSELFDAIVETDTSMSEDEDDNCKLLIVATVDGEKADGESSKTSSKKKSKGSKKSDKKSKSDTKEKKG
jgi:hypothetical protein